VETVLISTGGDRLYVPAISLDERAPCYVVRMTRSEERCVQAVAEHGTIVDAAKALALSPHTVDAHLDSLRSKTGLRHLPQLVAWAARRGCIRAEEDERVSG